LNTPPTGSDSVKPFGLDRTERSGFQPRGSVGEPVPLTKKMASPPGGTHEDVSPSRGSGEAPPPLLGVPVPGFMPRPGP
jgi:hypothetical protein